MADVGHSETPRDLPRGPHRLEREVVLASQRARMLDAMAHAVAAKGYASATVSDVVGGAGVSRKTFYEHFAGKQDCFLAAYDRAVETLVGAIVAARPNEPGVAALMRARVRAYLATLAHDPALARTFLLGVFAAGEPALEHRARAHRRFELLLAELRAQTRRDHPALPAVSAEVYTATVGAINELVSGYVRGGRVSELPKLEDALVDIQSSLLAGRAR